MLPVSASQDDVLDASPEVLLDEDAALVGIPHSPDGDGVVEVESGEGALGDALNPEPVYRHRNQLGLPRDFHVVPLVVVQQGSARHCHARGEE